MKVSGKRSVRVAELRKAAVAAVSRHGKFEDIGCMKVMTCAIGDITISYRTPFQKLPGPAAAYDYETALERQSMAGNSLGYGLDVWAGSRKVMNVEWQDDEMRVAAYKPGEWEARIAAA